MRARDYVFDESRWLLSQLCGHKYLIYCYLTPSRAPNPDDCFRSHGINSANKLTFLALLVRKFWPH